MIRIQSVFLFAALHLGVCLLVSNAIAQEKPFRPEAGKFPPLEKAYSYRGELVFVDHANRRGSIRVQGAGMYFRNKPHPFAMLPYGIIRYLGAPAELRDIPLGTVLHVRAFLPRIPSSPPYPCCQSTTERRTPATVGQARHRPKTTCSFLKTRPVTAFVRAKYGS